MNQQIFFFKKRANNQTTSKFVLYRAPINSPNPTIPAPKIKTKVRVMIFMTFHQAQIDASNKKNKRNKLPWGSLGARKSLGPKKSLGPGMLSGKWRHRRGGGMAYRRWRMRERERERERERAQDRVRKVGLQCMWEKRNSDGRRGKCVDAYKCQ